MTCNVCRLSVSVIAALFAGFAAHGPAFAQAYPSRPITIVVPFPPGAATDQIARWIQPRLAGSLGQPVVIENRGGANGNIAGASVAKAPPDGYRLLLGTQPILTINPHLYKDMGFDPLRELTPITNGVTGVYGLAVHPSLPVHTVAELIAYAKKNPGALNYGTTGAGSPQHMGGIRFSQRAQIAMTMVPYKGVSPMVQDLISGNINVGVATISALAPFVKDGKVRVIAVGDKTRFAAMPEIPTIAETLPGFEIAVWFGFFGPGGLPPDIVALLSLEIGKALRAPDVSAKLLEAGLPIVAEGPGPFAQEIRSEYDVYGKLVRDNGLSAE
jgi:tripartite-type tricarboxylate transporter receptor subunit TctC